MYLPTQMSRCAVCVGVSVNHSPKVVLGVDTKASCGLTGTC